MRCPDCEEIDYSDRAWKLFRQCEDDLHATALTLRTTERYVQQLDELGATKVLEALVAAK